MSRAWTLRTGWRTFQRETGWRDVTNRGSMWFWVIYPFTIRALWGQLEHLKGIWKLDGNKASRLPSWFWGGDCGHVEELLVQRRWTPQYPGEIVRQVNLAPLEFFLLHSQFPQVPGCLIKSSSAVWSAKATAGRPKSFTLKPSRPSSLPSNRGNVYAALYCPLSMQRPNKRGEFNQTLIRTFL